MGKQAATTPTEISTKDQIPEKQSFPILSLSAALDNSRKIADGALTAWVFGRHCGDCDAANDTEDADTVSWLIMVSQECNKSAAGNTYTPPVKKIPRTWIFRFSFIFKLSTGITGRAKIATSVMTLIMLSTNDVRSKVRKRWDRSCSRQGGIRGRGVDAVAWFPRPQGGQRNAFEPGHKDECYIVGHDNRPHDEGGPMKPFDLEDAPVVEEDGALGEHDCPCIADNRDHHSLEAVED